MSELSITIPRFDDLFVASRQLYWSWAEAEPFDEDDHKARLADILSGLAVGRLKVAVAKNRAIDIAVPAHHAPERLPATYLIGLTVAVTAHWLWAQNGDRWMQGSVAAQALAARLQLECPQVCGPEFTAHFQEVAYVAAGGRSQHWAERLFEGMR